MFLMLLFCCFVLPLLPAVAADVPAVVVLFCCCFMLVMLLVLLNVNVNVNVNVKDIGMRFPLHITSFKSLK